MAASSTTLEEKLEELLKLNSKYAQCNDPGPRRVRTVSTTNLLHQTDRVSPKIGQILGIEPYK